MPELVEPTLVDEAISVVDDDRADVERGHDGRSHLSQREGIVLADAAKALGDLHARICGCDSPGKIAYCSFDEFAALVPPRPDA